MEEKTTIIEGEIFIDHRGRLSSLNNFRFGDIQRMYVITHSDTSVVRAWHGHKFERKWFYCAKGAFTLAAVKIDDWHDPSPDLEPEIYRLGEHESRIVCLPAGYANGLKASEPGSVMIVFSDKILEIAELDSWRYDTAMWMDWDKY